VRIPYKPFERYRLLIDSMREDRALSLASYLVGSCLIIQVIAKL
jgi:hypothetical protein